jgi:hypothetical protein
MRDDIGDVAIPGQHIGIAGMLVQVALRLAKGDLRQRSDVDCFDQFGPTKLAMLKPVGSSIALAPGNEP